MMFAGLVGYFLVPIYGWKVMFLIGSSPLRADRSPALADAGITALVDSKRGG